MPELYQKAASLLVLARVASAFSAAATYFQPGLGACGGTNGEGDFIIALTSNMWEGGAHCGDSLTITYNGASAQATVADQCPTCPGGSDIDLSPAVFSALTNGDMGLGRITVDWSWGSGAAQETQPATTEEPEPTTTWSPTENTWTEQPVTITTEQQQDTYSPPSTTTTTPSSTRTSSSSTSSRQHHSSKAHLSSASGSARSSALSSSGLSGASSGFSKALKPSSTGNGASRSGSGGGVSISTSGNIQDAQKLVLQLANLVSNYVDKSG